MRIVTDFYKGLTKENEGGTIKKGGNAVDAEGRDSAAFG